MHALDPNPPTAVQRQPSRHLLRWVTAPLLIFAVSLGIAAEYAIHHAEPILRRRIVDTLSARFHTQAQLAALHITVLNGFGVRGEGLVIPFTSDSDAPLLQIKSFEFHTGLSSLLRSPTRVDTVFVQGLQFNLPPKGERPPLRDNSQQHKHASFVVDRIVCADATLVIETNKPGKVPLEFDIHQLVLTNVGPGEPFHFTANLVNPKPVGNIASTGTFGPFKLDSPADTPVSGQYKFTDADLSTTKGITGILSSTGIYGGLLDNIAVDGETDTPNFALDISDHALPLHTTFHAIVDGTTGNVTLAPVHALLAHSAFTAEGSITRTKGVPGHDIELNVTMDQAHIEDFLELGFKTEPPLMNGALRMTARLSIPPGKIRVAEKMHLNGDFHIVNATFNNPRFQQKVDMLSLRAEGQPKLANPDGAAGNTVASSMSGHVQAGDGALTVTNLEYDLPGAQVLLDGRYTMDGKTFDFRGLARTKATISQMTTGYKSALLKPFNRFFSKNGAGAQIPIKITGTNSAPHFGPDFRDKSRPQFDLPPPPQ